MVRSIQKGFTIVELLIVIVVIGILAAIVIVAFNGIQTRANNTIVESNLTNASKSIEMFKAEKDRYPASASDYSAVKASGLKLKSTIGNTLLYCVDTANPATYMIIAYAYPSKTYVWKSDGTKNRDSGVTIGGGTATCQGQMGGITTVAGVWSGDLATF